LTNAVMGDGVTMIGQSMFNACSSLASVTIPGSVTSIGTEAFYQCSSLASVTIPGSVTNIGAEAFEGCTKLTNAIMSNGVTSLGAYAFQSCTRLASVFFEGDAPAAYSTTFASSDSPTAYYLPGTTGWASFSATTGLLAVAWNPLIQSGDTSFGISNNQFGFNITGTTNIPIMVEACTNLANAAWTPLLSLNLANGLFYFSEPVQTNNAGRYYRISFP
jgi:hypothetical protein